MENAKKKTYESQTRAKAKYNKENYDRLYPFVKKGKKELYQEAAKKGGYESLNSFIEAAADKLMAEIEAK
ncbi:MAG: antitoxin [Eubacteriales bacterium]